MPSLNSPRKKRLLSAVKAGMEELGFSVMARFDPSALRGRYRLVIVSDDFKRLADAERQDLLWRVLKERWQRADQLRLTLTLALTRDEAGMNGRPSVRQPSTRRRTPRMEREP